jgi:hypothetical protein
VEIVVVGAFRSDDAAVIRSWRRTAVDLLPDRHRSRRS